MKPNTSIRSLTLALCVTLLTLAFAQAQDKPGIVLGDAVVITAKVEAIDKKDRAVALRGPAGNVFVVEVGDEVKNFKQIKVGDQVRVEYYVGGHKLLYILDCLKGDCIFCTNTPENLFDRLI